MATPDDVRRLVLALPETSEAPDRFAFTVRNGTRDRPLAWVWLERRDPDGPRVPTPDVIAVRVMLDEKEALLAAEPEVFFTEPHYDGYPAILVRLDAIGLEELEELLDDAWRMQAPRRVVRLFDDSGGRPVASGP